ncbi:MAG: glycosyl transferase [Bacillota bacterium]
MLMYGIYFFFGWSVTHFLIPFFYDLLLKANCVKENYRGESIPVSIGIIFVPVLTMLMLASILIGPMKDMIEVLTFGIGGLSMGFAGLLDDLIGNRDTTGLKGHITSLFRRQLTTGGFKAVFGGLVALLISIAYSKDLYNIVVNTMLIALFTNYANLLDLRPGRSIKGFLFVGILLLVLTGSQSLQILIIGMIGSVIAYFPYDVRAKSMMGDAGSNILGVTLGITSISLPMYYRMILLAFLIALHIYTEKYSLTKTIEKNKILKFIDELGRL